MARSPHRTARRVALAVAAWPLLSVSMVASFNLDLPPPLEHILSLLAAPGALALTVWTPLLRPLGLSSGAWLALPSPLGCALIVIIYAIIAYGVTRTVLRAWQ